MNSGENINLHGKHMSNSEIAIQVISKYTSSSSTANKRKSAPVSKDDEEYTRKRQRNNIAVKKSREKAKNKIQETQVRVEQLIKENEELQTKVTLLSKELNVLRALFTNGGFTLPCDLQLMNTGSNSPETSPVSQFSPIGSGEESIRQHLTPLPSVDPPEKSAFHSPEETKIPPLRPRPRVPRDIPSVSHKPHQHPTSQISPRSYVEERDTYKYSIKTDLTSAGVKPLLIPSSQCNLTSGHINFINSVPSHYKSETQHTSVIRSSSELNTSNNINTLGKFCIIQDPENNGQVKIVPISA